MLGGWSWRGGRDQHVYLTQGCQELLAQQDTRFEGAVIHFGRHQGSGLEPRARGTIEFSSTGSQDVVTRPGPFGISHAHKNCPRQSHQWDRDLAHLGPLLPQDLNRVVDRLLDLRMHASILVQFTDQTDAYAAQITPETGRV